MNTHYEADATGGGIIKKGQIYTAEFVSDDETLAWVDKESQSTEQHILLFSRLPHRRLLEHVDINAIEAYWLSERVTDGAIQPDIEILLSIILHHLSNHNGIVVLEGLEWLVTKDGEDATLSFVRKLRESVHRTSWTIVMPIRALAFESLWLARLRREAASIDLSQPKMEHKDVAGSDSVFLEDTTTGEDSVSFEIQEDGTPHLVMLTRLPPVGFTESLLRKRILQWRRMGLDVSEVEPALSMSEEESYALYSRVEEKVRRAVELERHVNNFIDELSSTEEATARFRIRQLTGLDELERQFFEN